MNNKYVHKIHQLTQQISGLRATAAKSNQGDTAEPRLSSQARSIKSAVQSRRASARVSDGNSKRVHPKTSAQADRKFVKQRLGHDQEVRSRSIGGRSGATALALRQFRSRLASVRSHTKPVSLEQKYEFGLHSHEHTTMSRDYTTVSGSDLLAEISMDSNLAMGACLYTRPVAPMTMPGSTMHTYAQLFGQYRFKHLVFEWIPECSATEDGGIELMFAANPNENHSFVQGIDQIREAMARQNSVLHSVYASAFLRVPTDSAQLPWYFTSDFGEDDLLGFIGSLWVLCGSQSSTSYRAGLLVMHYTIEFKNSTLDVPPVADLSILPAAGETQVLLSLIPGGTGTEGSLVGFNVGAEPWATWAADTAAEGKSVLDYIWVIASTNTLVNNAGADIGNFDRSGTDFVQQLGMTFFMRYDVAATAGHELVLYANFGDALAQENPIVWSENVSFDAVPTAGNDVLSCGTRLEAIPVLIINTTE